LAKINKKMDEIAMYESILGDFNVFLLENRRILSTLGVFQLGRRLLWIIEDNPSNV